jgi:hypothetical protein
VRVVIIMSFPLTAVLRHPAFPNLCKVDWDLILSPLERGKREVILSEQFILLRGCLKRTLEGGKGLLDVFIGVGQGEEPRLELRRGYVDPTL